MTKWQPIETAPKDGSVIIGKDADGNEAEIEYRSIHPKAPSVRRWFVVGEKRQGHWIVSTPFRPVAWQPLLAPPEGEL